MMVTICDDINSSSFLTGKLHPEVIS